MNRKTAKLLRGFAKATNTNYRNLKDQYYKMNDNQRHNAKMSLVKFWEDSSNILNHRKYYDLKLPLKPNATPTVESNINNIRQDNIARTKRNN